MTKHMKFADRMALIAREPDVCWPWPLSRDKGYGLTWVAGKLVKAHRAAYELLVGPIPPGLQIDHLCRNRACVNPSHMEPVTQHVNILRGVGFAAVNAIKTHCPQGHPYDETNTKISKKGRRHCRTCLRKQEAKRRQRADRPSPIEYDL